MTQTTFREAYRILQQHAETLREQSEPNIDELLTIVTESVAAYKTCKSRIDAVEKALEAALTGVDDEPGDAATKPAAKRPAFRPAPTSPPAAMPGGDDDIPF